MNPLPKEKLYFVKIYFNGGGVIIYDNLTRQQVTDFMNHEGQGLRIDPMVKINGFFTEDYYDMINISQALLIEVGLKEKLPFNTRYGRTHNLLPGF
jgi:hypothetical protein